MSNDTCGGKSGTSASGKPDFDDPSKFVYGVSDYVLEHDEAGAGDSKMLKYWEKNIIPKVQDYVRGSFKDYEVCVEYYVVCGSTRFC